MSQLRTMSMFVLVMLALAGCGFEVTSLGSKSGSIISGIISPLVGSIAETNNSFLISNATATTCADPVTAKLFKISADGTYNDSMPLSSQLIGADARYSFSLQELNLLAAKNNSAIEFIVKAEGCNGNVYKRPVTSFDKTQDLDAKTTVVTAVMNTVTSKKINEVSRKDVELLINSMSGTTTGAALDSLTNQTAPSEKFTQIFGSSPAAIEDSRPEVVFNYPSATVNELAVSNFSVSAFQVDPNYSFAYRWKLDGVIKSSLATWNFIPSANDSGNHRVDLYVGKNDGAGNIDLAKPYYTKTVMINVNNNIMPVAPNVILNAATPSPRTIASLDIDINTGVSFANCATFSTLAVSETTTAPGIMQFNIDCDSEGTQTESINLSSGDGNKILYLWAMDRDGNISLPKTINFVLDTTAPIAIITSPAAAIIGSATKAITLSASDAATGLATLKLYYSNDNGLTYSLLANLATNATTYSWSVPASNTSTNILKLEAVDNVGFSTIIYSSAFAIDSLAPSAPSLTRVGSANQNTTGVAMTLGSCTDTSLVLITELNSAPGLTASGWQNCSTTLGAMTATMTGEGNHTFYAWARDTVGNIASSANNVTFNLDTTSPVVTSAPLIATSIMGGSTQPITWTASDANTVAIQLEYFDGSTWNNIASGLTNTGSYSWTVPSLNITTGKVRITATDLAGNSVTSLSNTFTIDSTAPVIQTFSLAGGTASVALPSVSIQVGATDLSSGLFQMRLSESAGYANNNWQSFSTTSGTFNLSMVSGSKTVYIWVKDNVGNVSASSSTAIALDFGNPPSVSITMPITGAGPFITGDQVHIEWSCSSANGLDASPVRIQYTQDDGTTFIPASGWIENNLTLTTGSFDWTLPAGVSVFRLLVECKSAAGVVASSFSTSLNTSGWTIFAGDPASMSENISATLALMSKGTSGFQHLAADKNGNIFFSKNNVIMKVDSQTGLVTRFAGDPANGSCNMQAGSNPLSSAFNRIGANHTIFGMNLQRDSLIIGTCSKVWLLNTSTSALSILNNTSAYNSGPFFFNKTGYLFYASSGYIYKLNFNLVDQAPVVIMGNGTCAATTSTAGTDATSAAIPGPNAGGCSGETYLFSNSDDTKLWVGCWSGVSGCQNSARIDWDAGNNKFIVGSNNVGWGMQDWDLNWCQPSYVSNRVWCSSRHNTGNRSTFDTQLAAWTKLALGKTVFIRYAATPTGMVSLTSDNILTNYTENADATITTGQIGGSDIETYGNGNNFSKLAFSAIEDIYYSPGLNSVFVDTSVKVRRINLTTTQATTTNYSGAINSGYLNRMTWNSTGTKMTTIFNCSGNLYLNSIFDGTNFTAASPSVMDRNSCGQSTYDATYPVVSGTTASTRVNWLVDYNRRPLFHSNGKFYYSAADASANNVMIYSSSAGVLNIVAGITGASGYSGTDSGGFASVALLKDVRSIMEIPSGKPNAGDLLIVDNNRLRLITIVTESAAPKIYDLVVFSLATNYGSDNSNTFTDVVYDFNSEILNGSSAPILGTGAFYYVTSANVVRKFKVDGVTGNTPTSAIVTSYDFTGTSLVGNIRLALIPTGLLVTQPNKNRILRVAP